MVIYLSIGHSPGPHDYIGPLRYCNRNVRLVVFTTLYPLLFFNIRKRISLSDAPCCGEGVGMSRMTWSRRRGLNTEVTQEEEVEFVPLLLTIRGRWMQTGRF